MDKFHIIEELGRQRKVEAVVQNITHSATLSTDLKDLCQNIYLSLLDYPANLLEDLWGHPATYGGITQMDCFIVRIVRNQLSPTGPFGWQRQRDAKFIPIDGHDMIDDDTAQ